MAMSIIQWEDRGKRIDGKIMNSFMFPDDIMLLVDTDELQSLERSSRRMGPTMNLFKTKTNSRKGDSLKFNSIKGQGRNTLVGW